MIDNVMIFKADERDVERLSQLSYEVGKMHDEALPNYFKPSTLEDHKKIINKMLADDSVVIFKAEILEKIVGFLVLFVSDKPRNGYVYQKWGYIYHFGVDEAYRNQGIGTKLLKATEEYLCKREIYALELSVFMFNEKAFSFYEKQGYSVLERHLRKVFN